MLKAVRFDESKHEDLLNFITNYEDSNGKKNESKAIRHLMKIGFEFLKGNQPDLTHVEQEKIQPIDISSLKQEILLELSKNIPQHTPPIQQSIDLNSLKLQILSELKNDNTTNQLVLDGLEMIANKLSNISITNVSMQDTKNEETKMVPTKRKRTDIPADMSPLLANILANSERG